MRATDMRKAIDSMAALVNEIFELDLFSENLFVFCNREKDKLEILRWNDNAFWVHYRWLEKLIIVNCGGFWTVWRLSNRRLTPKSKRGQWRREV